MKLCDLIDQTRKQSADAVAQPQLWSDRDITFYLNHAYREACERSKLIRDDVTDATDDGTPVTLIPITTTTVTTQNPNGFNFLYQLHPSIFQIDSIMYEDTQIPLLEVSEDRYKKDRWHHRYGYGYATPGIFGDYNTASAGRATGFWPKQLPDGTWQIRLLPFPNANTYVDANNVTQPIQLRLTVYRRGIELLRTPSDEPEFDPRWHLDLIWGAAARMLRRKDIDSYDPGQADKFDAEFIKVFGPPISADVLRQRTEYRRNRTRSRMP